MLGITFLILHCIYLSRLSHWTQSLKIPAVLDTQFAWGLPCLCFLNGYIKVHSHNVWLFKMGCQSLSTGPDVCFGSILTTEWTPHFYCLIFLHFRSSEFINRNYANCLFVLMFLLLVVKSETPMTCHTTKFQLYPVNDT